MNPELLALALRTPMERLLPLPNAIRIVLWVKEALARFDERQFQELLSWIDARIEDAVALDGARTSTSRRSSCRCATSRRCGGPCFPPSNGVWRNC